MPALQEAGVELSVWRKRVLRNPREGLGILELLLLPAFPEAAPEPMCSHPGRGVTLLQLQLCIERQMPPCGVEGGGQAG